MRISETERQQIIYAAVEHFGAWVRVVLFGSRVRDEARGGDLDLLIDVTRGRGISYADAEKRKITFLVDLKRRIGDRKIDVVIRTADSVQRPIDRVADREGVPL